uniref:Uncharacterized protein n=1 Tax=Chlamydomonas leiostraca TaxID=1034604 RepID=A0A7S0WR40_9CHLO|mmetsp:Transcript_2454/g.6297  ORF Transcript_2454/g.6297 Transcript_2454/m.6297 type:complete len:237 (+) Transcript_2454:453-1163(+)
MAVPCTGGGGVSKRGRRARALAALSQYLHPCNGHEAGAAVAASSTDHKQHVWWLSCRQHTTIKTAGAIARSMRRTPEHAHTVPPALVCKECHAGRAATMGMRMPSLWEQCMGLFLHGEGLVAVREFKALQGSWGAIDFWLPAFSLGIMVDGEQHFPSHSSGHHTSSSMEQAARDARFNAEVPGAGGKVVKGLVRLHHHDMPYWMRHVRRGVTLAQQPGVSVFVIYSKSYGCKDSVI